MTFVCRCAFKHSLTHSFMSISFVYYFCPGEGGFLGLPGNGSSYCLSSTELDYAKAKAACEAMGAILMCPETLKELTSISNFLRTRK